MPIVNIIKGLSLRNVIHPPHFLSWYFQATLRASDACVYGDLKPVPFRRGHGRIIPAEFFTSIALTGSCFLYGYGTLRGFSAQHSRERPEKNGRPLSDRKTSISRDPLLSVRDIKSSLTFFRISQ